MKKWIRKLTGFVLGTFLAIGLSGKANAQTETDELPPPPPIQAEDHELSADETVETSLNTQEVSEAETIPLSDDMAAAASVDSAIEANTDPAVEEVVEAVQADETEETEETVEAVQTEETEETVEAVQADETVETEETVEAVQADETVETEETEETEDTAVAEANAPLAGSSSMQTLVLSGTRQAVRSVNSAAPLRTAAPGDPGAGDGDAPLHDSSAEEDSGVLVLTGSTHTQPVTSDAELVIRTSGLQHITTLTSDGDVYIVGTGILLIDNVDLLQGCSVYLQSVEKIYGEYGGTAALFVKTGEGEYTLVNSVRNDGDATTVIPAILDEGYEIPEGITLVVPEGGDLVMQGVIKRTETAIDADGNEVSAVGYSITREYPPELLSGMDCHDSELTVYVPSLTIKTGAGLVLSKGASFRLIDVYNTPIKNHRPKLNIQGSFTSWENVAGADAALNSGWSLGGSFAFENSTVSVNGESKDGSGPSVVGSTVHLNEVALSSLTVLPEYLPSEDGEAPSGYVSRSSTLVYYGYPSIGTLTVAEGATLNFYGSKTYGYSDAVTVTSRLGGQEQGAGSVVVCSGILAIGADAAVQDIISVKSENAVAIYDYSHTLTPGSVTGTGTFGEQHLPRIEPDGIDAGSSAIPVIGFTVKGSGGGFGGQNVEGYFTDVTSYNAAYTKETVTVEDVAELLKDEETPSYWYILLEMNDGGIYSFYSLRDDGDSVPASKVERICIYIPLYLPSDGPGASSTTVTTSNTGAGILGGSGAGSVGGNTALFALSGTRVRSESVSPSPDPTTDPTEENPAAEVWTAPGALNGVRVTVTELAEEGAYTVSVTDADGNPVSDLGGGKVEARFSFILPSAWNADTLFAVFRLPDGTLKAVKAFYDPDTRTLFFETDVLGEFVLVNFDFDGDLFSKEFYAALAELPELDVLG